MHIPVPSRWPDGWLQVSRRPMKALGDHDNLYLLGEGVLPIAHTPLTLNVHVGHSSGKSGLAASF